MADTLPGKGLLGWLGRQIGYVKHAIGRQVGQTVVYRQENVEEAGHPQQSGVTLRRTTIDEVIDHGGTRHSSRDQGTDAP
jgi:hypothetical protein